MWRAETRKLRAQLASRLLVLVCVLGPLAFGLILNQQASVPADTLLGVWVHESGYAVSLVVLGFAGYLGFPVVAGVVAGDLFSSEDRYGTWKTVLTRSCTTEELFVGKVLAAATFATGLTAIAAVSSVVAGLVFTGNEPLVGLGGMVISSGDSLLLVLVSWLLSIPPVLGFTCLAILFSVASRNGIVGVLGPLLVALIMQLLLLIGSGTVAHALLLTSAFADWHGLLSAPKFYGPMIIGLVVSVLWAAACLAVSWKILRSRDFAGTPVPRRSRVGAAAAGRNCGGGADPAACDRRQLGAGRRHEREARSIDRAGLRCPHGAPAEGAGPHRARGRRAQIAYSVQSPFGRPSGTG